MKVFNTLTQQKEELVPLSGEEFGLYVCGPTVYNLIHIGNARTFTAFDVVVRYLRHRGRRVKYVRNFTDVDDRIIASAQKEGRSAQEFAAHFIAEFQKDAQALGLCEPDFSPKVSETIEEVIRLIEKLVAAGVAYESHGDVYFAVQHYPGYARLSRRHLDELRAGERVAPGENKREPLDFALWKAAKPGEPSWQSPWGLGRPGWHIECSAMAAKYLGESIDIHGGGRDLIFPHHDNELAQSEAAFKKPFARYWMHCGFVELEGTKMSKSLGNILMLREALAQVDAESLRLFFLSTHYRHPLSLNDRSLPEAELRMEYFYETLRKVDEKLSRAPLTPGPLWNEPQKWMADFEAAMDDDFNVPLALASVSAVFSQMNELADRPPIKDKAQVARTVHALRDQVKSMGTPLGLFGDEPLAWLSRRRERALAQKQIDREKVQSLLASREAARAGRDFKSADALRNELQGMGIEVMDGPSGTHWRVLG
jgi:cysteinyl-tRNA synthetase